MKPPLLISIVIPTYNRARDLERALRSVLAQTHTHWEALVVDNHSSDNSDGVIKSFGDSRIKLYKIHNDGVIAASRNMGIGHAQGEYIAFLDSDDWWSTRKLEESLKHLEQGADVVYHDLYLVTRLGQRFFWRRARTRDLRSPVFRDLIANGNALNTSSVVIRRGLLNAINGLAEDRNLIAIEDYDAWLRVAKVSEKFKRIPKVLGCYWAGGGSTSNPDRTINTLAAIEERYACAISDYGGTGDVAWLNYAKGRAYYLLGSYERAKRTLGLIRWGRAPLAINVKARWMLLRIEVYHQARR